VTIWNALYVYFLLLELVFHSYKRQLLTVLVQFYDGLSFPTLPIKYVKYIHRDTPLHPNPPVIMFNYYFSTALDDLSKFNLSQIKRDVLVALCFVGIGDGVGVHLIGLSLERDHRVRMKLYQSKHFQFFWICNYVFVNSYTFRSYNFNSNM